MATESSGTQARKALGRGIGALLETRRSAASAEPVAAIRQIPVDSILPNPYQPRRSFHPDRLNELAASIQSAGVVQPILVRPRADDKYEIVAGERRWRAARIAGLAAVPALIERISNERLLETALVENIQREDLNAIEMAQAFEQLIREFALTHEQIAHRTGKDRATITNYLRLLKLPVEVQMLVAENKLTMGHAKVLIGLDADTQRGLAAKIVAQGLSVRVAERLVQKSKEKSPPAMPEPLDPNLRAAIQEMERALGTRVRVVEAAGGRGRIEIDYYSPDDLDRLYRLLTR